MIYPDLHVLNEPGHLGLAAAKLIGDAIKKTILKNGTCRIALAGGKTPAPIYRALCQSEFIEPSMWNKIEIFFGDERCVPPSSPDSNYKMVRENLLEHLPAGAKPLIHRIKGENSNKHAAAVEYEKNLSQGLDILLLGMGQDGHTASLFPGAKAIDENTHLVTVVQSPKPPPWRITITPGVFEMATDIFVLAIGQDKAQALARALQGSVDPKTSPVQLALKGTWIVDRAAASNLVLSNEVINDINEKHIR